MSVLAGEQFNELHEVLVTAFDDSTLKLVVRASLGKLLENIVNTHQGFEAIVTELLAWVERQGQGAVEQLLRQAASRLPDDERLHDFCRQYFPKSLEKLDSAAIVQTINLGLTALIGLKDQPALRETVGRFRYAFESTREQILIVKKYKGLHDSLHELQLRLGAIGDALARSRTDKTVVRTLGRYAVELKWAARGARKQIPGLPNLMLEQGWVDDFETCINEMESAAKSAVTAVDLDQLAAVSVRLRELLGEAPRINQALANCVASLRLGWLSDTMHVIAEKIRPGAESGDQALLQLEVSSGAVGELRYRLEGLVGEHSEWQWLNKELDATEHSSKHQPQARMPRWQQFKDRLTGLCDLYPNEDWSTELKSRIALWIEATPAPEPGDAEKAAGESAFAEFHRACILRFYDVDVELNDLCAQMTDVAAHLNTLLTVIK
jgi:hypothetical protein